MLNVGDGGSSGRLGSGSVVLNGGALAFNRSGVLVAGNQISGTNGITKRGTGAVVLSGVNAYAGITSVLDGVLLVNGTHTAQAGYTVANGATLGGNGQIFLDSNTVTFSQGAKVAPGGLSGGGMLRIDLASQMLDLKPVITGAATGGLAFQLGHPEASSRLVLSNEDIGSPQIDIGIGLLNFDDFHFTLTSGFEGGEFVLLQTVYGIEGTLGSQLTGEINGLAASIYFGEDDYENMLMLTVAAPIPEPGTFALLIGSFALLTWSRGLRRRTSV